MKDIHIKNFLKFIAVPNRNLSTLKEIRLVQYVTISAHIGSESLINLFTDAIMDKLEVGDAKLKYEELKS
jgi:hypothetical protein